MTTGDDTIRQMISGHPRKKSIPSYAWSFASKQIGWFRSEVGPRAILSAHSIWTHVVAEHRGQFLTTANVADAIASDDNCRSEYELSPEHKKYVDFMLGEAVNHYNAILSGVLDCELLLLPSGLIDTETYNAWWQASSQSEFISIESYSEVSRSRNVGATIPVIIKEQLSESHDLTAQDSPERTAENENQNQSNAFLEWLTCTYPDAVSGRVKLPKRESVWKKMLEDGIASGYNDAKAKWHLLVPKEWRRGRGQQERR